MRTVLILLFVVFIGFGFLLSDNLHVRQDFTEVNQQNIQLAQDAKTLQDQVTVLENENIKLNEQIGQFAASNAALQGQVYNLQKENSAIRDQNSQLQSKINHMTAISSWMSNLESALSDPISLAIFIPFVPLSLGTAYIWLRSRKISHSGRNRNIKPSRKLSVQITEEELKELIKIRRM